VGAAELSMFSAVVLTVEDNEGWQWLLHIQVAVVYYLMIGVVN
jgi:hypothetical protein